MKRTEDITPVSPGNSPRLARRAAVLVKRLMCEGLTLSLAESCTGGLVADHITDIPGVSRVFRGCVVSYSDDMKISVLGVPAGLIEREGAVSGKVAAAMAQGARVSCGSDVAGAVTGIAGPGGATSNKPVGLAYVACSGPWGTDARKVLCSGDRRALKIRFADELMKALIERTGERR